MASKSLGTLTLDLIAKVGGFEAGMDKASRKAKTTSGDIEKSLNKVGQAIAGMTVAAVGGLSAMVTSTAESGREITNLAKLSNASREEFQRGAYAVGRYGIETEKYADILKDTNDRIGDFIQTGGGPMADFFENIAPLVGVTADEFARLSGPDALQLYVDSLEKAGVSQKDMTFYMEAIAGDAAKLIPLLQNNGAEFQRLGDEAERTGNVFSEMDFAELEKITESTDQLQASFKGISNEIVLAAIPAVNDLTEMLGDQGTVDAAQAIGNAVVTSINGAVKAIKGAIQVTQFLAEELAALTNGAAADDIVRLEDQLATLEDMMESPSLRLRFFGKDGLVEYYDEEELRAEIAKVKQQIEQARSNITLSSGRDLPDAAPVSPSSITAPDITTPSGMNRTGKEARDAAEALAELEQALADMRDEFSPAQAEFNRYADQLDLIDQFAITAEEKEKLREDAFEAHQQRMAQIATEGFEQRSEIEKSYWQRYLEAAALSLEDFQELAGTVLENFAGQFGDAFESVIFDAENLGDAIDGLAEGMARSVVNAIGQMAAQWVAYQAVQLALGQSTSAASIAQAAATGSAIASAYAPAASMASLASFGANSAPAIAGITATTAAAESLALVGMAHEGMDSVPKTGTWLLEKGERVTTSETSAKLDQTLDDVRQGQMAGGPVEVTNVFQISAGVAGTVRAEFMKLMPLVEERSKSSVLAAINNGGAMARATGRRR